MPECIPGTNMWNLLNGEFFESNDGRMITGPIVGLRINEFPGTGLLNVQGPNGLYEINGKTVKDFEKVVKKST